MPPADFAVWRSRLHQPFLLATAFASFLRRRLRVGLSPYGRVLSREQAKEPEAEIGVSLFSPQDISDLVSTDTLTVVEAEQPTRSFSMCAIEDPAGLAGIKIADAWLIDMCDNALGLRDYEDTLARIPGFVEGPVRSRLARVPANRRVLLVGLGLGVATLTVVVVADKTLQQGRIVNKYVFPPLPSPSPSPSPSASPSPSPSPSR